MADVAKIFRINYKSDFILTLTSDAGWMTPFCIKFWTGAPSQAYYVSWDGETYNHCSFDPSEPTKLLVQFDDHHLPIGNLKFQVAYHFTVADFPNDTEDEVINPANITTEIDGETYQVMLDFTGETAPEIQFALPAYANEAQRIDNEQQRIAAETQRIANEETRIQHEESRIAAEQTRQQNEQQRINQEQARVNEYASLKADAVAATGAANDAAALANQKAQLAADKAALAQAAADLANAKALLAADKAALAASAAQLANDKAALAQQKAEYAQTQGGYAKDQGDYAKDKGDICSADHLVAVADHGIAVDDHTQAGNDHTRAESDHGIAVDDHTQAGNDHTRAESDHGIAADDHTQAGTDHQTAAADHQTATADHTHAGNDHTRAESDHTRAESDHAAVEVYVDSLGAFDISAYHATGGVLAKYADLTAALDTNGANVPDALRKGGMSVKFVQSSDNKYVQFFLNNQTFTTDVYYWEKVNLEKDVVGLSQDIQVKIDPGYYFEFRKRFIANGYYSPVNNYSCTSILEGDGSEYVFPSTTIQFTYKVFQYVNDSEGIEITDGWQNAELRFNITGKFVVTFYGTFTEQDKSVYEWLVANWRLGGYNVALEPRIAFLENSALLEIMEQGAALVGKTKNKDVFIPFPEFYTKNLLNLDDPDVMLGYRQYSDTPQASGSYNLSGYIPVSPGVTYCYSTSNTTYAVIQYYAVFDKNRNFVRGSVYAITTFTAQPGDAFIRITLRTLAWGDKNQFEVGLNPTVYEPFSVDFKYKKIYSPEIVMPSSVYIAKGVENSIYHKNYCNFLTDDFVVSSYRNYNGAKWRCLSRCFRTNEGGQSLEMMLYCKNPNKLITRHSIQTIVGDPATDNGAVKAICIGDSFTYDGRYLQQIADICPNINLVGMREPAQNIQSDSIRCEGRGGWTLAEYKLPYSDLTPSHMQPFSPFVQVAGYNYYGPTPFWAAIVNGTSQYGYGTNGFEDYAEWFGTDGYKLNPNENDLMFDGTNFKYWNGSSWATYSGTPTFAFDFAKYISIWQISAPDFVFIFLGKNDFNDGISGWSTFKQDLDALISSIHSYDGNIIVGVCTPTTADEAPNNSDNRDAWLSHMNMWQARKLLIKNYDELSASKVFIVDTGTTLDPDYGFVLEERPPFAFYEGNEKELFAINGVHPSGAGYKQIGTCIAGFIQAKR